ncbi:MAG: hypothetical protein RQ966_09385 [Acetobacteraceae bacterium]|nr:hypothetical protein [Acetobacteraceae bacterium]
MPTIKQLPSATAVGGSDLLPLSQNGLTRSTTVTTLLNNTQPLLSLAQGTLLGRVSAGLGSPEAISIGAGLALQAGACIASGTDHLSYPLEQSLSPGDELIVNSAATPKRLPAVKLRSLFTAGSGVQIDDTGTISVTAAASGGGSGVAGPKGDTGAQGPAGQGFTFRGVWQANTSYSAYDVVTSGGQTYVAAVSVPAAATFSAASWVLAAAQGAAGSTGPAGATGPAGPTVPATAAMVGAVKPGTGLSVAADGTLNISNVSLASIGQGGAAVGQLLGWSGTGWAPTTPASGVSLTGAAPITVASGVVSLAQNGATSGNVLTWSGSAWVPQAPSATGAAVGTALPLSNGVASAGTATAASREDHRHPTDTSRAPLSSPVFAGSITLPSWTTANRPASPAPGMEGYATDTARRETYTPAGWVQYVRVSDLPKVSGQLIGSTSVAGTTTSVAIGSGLSLFGGILSATGAPVVASVTGVTIDGTSTAASTASPYQMATADRVVDVNKTAGAQTKIVLPQSPTLWVDYTVIDGKGDAAVNNITLTAAQGGTINGQPTFVMNANNDAITLRAINATTWRIT